MAHAAHGLQPCMLLHGCEAATVTLSGDIKMLLQAGTALTATGQRLRQISPRQERQLAKGMNKWKHGLQAGRSDAKVCRRPSAAEGPSATLRTS